MNILAFYAKPRDIFKDNSIYVHQIVVNVAKLIDKCGLGNSKIIV